MASGAKSVGARSVSTLSGSKGMRRAAAVRLSANEGVSKAGRKAKSMVEVSARAKGFWVVWKDCIKGMVRVLDGMGCEGR